MGHIYIYGFTIVYRENTKWFQIGRHFLEWRAVTSDFKLFPFLWSLLYIFRPKCDHFVVKYSLILHFYVFSISYYTFSLFNPLGWNLLSYLFHESHIFVQTRTTTTHKKNQQFTNHIYFFSLFLRTPAPPIRIAPSLVFALNVSSRSHLYVRVCLSHSLLSLCVFVHLDHELVACNINTNPPRSPESHTHTRAPQNVCTPPERTRALPFRSRFTLCRATLLDWWVFAHLCTNKCPPPIHHIYLYKYVHTIIYDMNTLNSNTHTHFLNMILEFRIGFCHTLEPHGVHLRTEWTCACVLALGFLAFTNIVLLTSILTKAFSVCLQHVTQSFYMNRVPKHMYRYIHSLHTTPTNTIRSDTRNTQKPTNRDTLISLFAFIFISFFPIFRFSFLRLFFDRKVWWIASEWPQLLNLPGTFPGTFRRGRPFTRVSTLLKHIQPHIHNHTLLVPVCSYIIFRADWLRLCTF